MPAAVFVRLFPVPPGNRRNMYLVEVRKHNDGNDPGMIVRAKSSASLAGAVLKSPAWLRKALKVHPGQLVHVGPVVGAVRSIKFLTVIGRFGAVTEKAIKKELQKVLIVNAYTELKVVLGNDKVVISVGECTPPGSTRVRSNGQAKTKVIFEDPDSETSDSGDTSSDDE